jgi:CDP-diacylglycerol--glycerol-3-phosphate 3-phosphatidyltransferase
MLSRWFRTWTPRFFHPPVTLFHHLGITPNLLTAASLAAALLAGWLVAHNQLGWAGLALALSGIFDSLDGELARQFQMETRLGPFLDSAADHYGDFAVILGILLLALQHSNPILIVSCFFALFGSVVGSHLRSRAGMIGVDTKAVGFFTRMERTLVLLIGLLTGYLTPAMVVLAVAVNLSALQRLVYVVRAAGKSDKRESDRSTIELPKSQI